MHSNPYQSMVSLLSNIVEAYTTAFFIVDPRNRQLNMVASQSLSKYLPEHISLPLEQSGILAQVQKVGQTIHLDKLEEATPSISTTLPFYRVGESHIKGLFALPVGDGAGVLYVDTKYSWGFNNKHQKYIQEVAKVLDELMQRQENHQSQKNQGRVLTLWKKVDESHFREESPEAYCQLLINECAHYLTAEYGFLALKEPRKHHYHVLAATPNTPRNITAQHMMVKHGLVGRIFQNRKPLHIGRLNPQTSDHFLFTPSEGLPHQGTFWGHPAHLSLGHTAVMAFLARKPMEWNTDDQYAISHLLQSFRLLLEQFYFKEECDRLKAYDLSTGLYNTLAFEAKVETALASSMESSSPLTLALMQFEPWQLIPAKATPKQMRKWLSDLALSIREALPEHVELGQLSENRIGLLFAGTTPQEVRNHLSYLMDLGQEFFTARIKGIRLHPYTGSVSFPQDATRGDELWPLVYRQLYSAIRSKSERTSTQK